MNLDYFKNLHEQAKEIKEFAFLKADNIRIKAVEASRGLGFNIDRLSSIEFPTNPSGPSTPAQTSKNALVSCLEYIIDELEFKSRNVGSTESQLEEYEKTIRDTEALVRKKDDEIINLKEQLIKLKEFQKVVSTELNKFSGTA